MEKYKKYLRHIIPFVIMTVSLCLSVFSLYNNPAIIYEYDNILEGLIVSDVRGNLKSYTIPESINDIPIVGIGVRAFYDHSDLEEVIFSKPENIKLIDRLAFSLCPKLKTIDLRYVSDIGRNAFAYDISLDNIEINSKHILGSTFFKCESLKNITLLDGVETIGTFAFSHTNIDILKLPKNIRVIYPDAFKYMNLSKLYIPLGFESDSIKEYNSIIEEY